MTFEIAQAGGNHYVNYLVSWLLVSFFFFFIGPKNVQRLKLEWQLLINIYQ